MKRRSATITGRRQGLKAYNKELQRRAEKGLGSAKYDYQRINVMGTWFRKDDEGEWVKDEEQDV